MILWGTIFQSVTPDDLIFCLCAPGSLCSSHTVLLIILKHIRLAPASGPWHLLSPSSGSLFPRMARGSLPRLLHVFLQTLAVHWTFKIMSVPPPPPPPHHPQPLSLMYFSL